MPSYIYKFPIWVDDHANVYAAFGATYARIQGWRSTTGLEADRALFTTIDMNNPTTDPPGSPMHEIIDSAGQDTYVMWTRYYNSDTGEFSTFSAPWLYGMLDLWYVDLQDIRDEGITSSVLSDTRAIKLIRQAQSFLDDATGRHFLPRAKTIKIDSRDMQTLVLPEPIVKIDSLSLEELVSGSDPTETTYDHNSLRIYNRHLTQRLLRPDDRDFPRIEITPEFVPAYRPTGSFPRTRQQMKIVGVFGYTELHPSDEAGETSAGSQVPKSWGRCPPMMQDAMMRLISRWISPHGDVEMRRYDESIGRLKSWKTDKQSATYMTHGDTGIPYITGDVDIDRTLYRYSRDHVPQVGVV